MELWLTSRACRVRLLMDVWTILFISTWFMVLCISAIAQWIFGRVYLGNTSWISFHARISLSFYDRVCYCQLRLN